MEDEHFDETRVIWEKSTTSTGEIEENESSNEVTQEANLRRST
jgi:hypothetical protein